MKVEIQTFELKTGEIIQIREASTEDAANLQHTIAAYTATSEYLLLTPASTLNEERQWIRDFSNSEDSLLLVALHEDKIVGNIDISSAEGNEQEKAGLIGMGILADYQSKGLGTLLLNAAIAWAKENSHLSSLLLQVFGNNQNAIGLYQNAGFVEEDRQPSSSKDSLGNYFDNVVMSLKL